MTLIEVHWRLCQYMCNKLWYESGLLPSVVSCRSLQQVSHLTVSLPEWYISFARIILFFSRQGGLQLPQPPHPVRWWTLGSLRNDDDDRNENDTKATLRVHHAFLYIYLPSLHDCNVKLPIFTFSRGREQKTTIFCFFSRTLIQSFRIQLQKICLYLTN